MVAVLRVHTTELPIISKLGLSVDVVSISLSCYNTETLVVVHGGCCVS